MTSASSAGHSATMRRAPASLGSLVSGLLHRSMVFAVPSVALPHQVSHHSHSYAFCQRTLRGEATNLAVMLWTSLYVSVPALVH